MITLRRDVTDREIGVESMQVGDMVRGTISGHHGLYLCIMHEDENHYRIVDLLNPVNVWSGDREDTNLTLYGQFVDGQISLTS